MAELSKYTIDLVAEARANRLDPVIGREPEIRRAMQILGRRSKNNPVLVGEPGVGKTAIVEGLATRIAEGKVPESLKSKRILSLDLAQLMAGTRYRGDFEERMTEVMTAIIADPDIILFIDELHSLLGTGNSEGALDAANMLKPALARREFACIGATTTTEYTQHLCKDKALARRFQPILVNEPSADDTLVILRGIKDRYESHHRIRISDSALVAAVRVAEDKIPDRFFPDKAIDLIDEAASQLKLVLESVPEEVSVAEEECARLQILLRAIESEEGKTSTRYRDHQQLTEVALQRADWLASEWRAQRDIVVEIRKLLAEEERLRIAEERARRLGQLDQAAKLAYIQLPQVSLKIEELERTLEETGEDNLMRDCVVAEDVYAVAAMWTGIPRDKLARE